MSLPTTRRRQRPAAQVATSQSAPPQSAATTEFKFLRTEPDRKEVASANANSAFAEMARIRAAELREQIFNEGEILARTYVDAHMTAIASALEI